MKGCIAYTLHDSLQHQERIKPGFTALFDAMRAKNPWRATWWVLMKAKLAYEKGVRA
jgi:hypothetical protein